MNYQRSTIIPKLYKILKIYLILLLLDCLSCNSNRFHIFMFYCLDFLSCVTAALVQWVQFSTQPFLAQPNKCYMQVNITLVDIIRCTYCKRYNTTLHSSSCAKWNNGHIVVIAELSTSTYVLGWLWKHYSIRQLVPATDHKTVSSVSVQHQIMLHTVMLHTLF